MLTGRRRHEDGFTLIELVITVTILSIITVALVEVVFAYVQNSNSTSTRLNESSDQQFASAYWQQDVSSLGSHGDPSGGTLPSAQGVWTDGSSSGCAPSSGTVIAMFAWKDYGTASTTDPTLAWSGATQNYATYYWKTVTNTNGTQQVQLWRKRCGASNSDFVLARYLTAPPTVGCTDSSGATVSCSVTTPAFPADVSITLTVRDRSLGVPDSTGYTTTLTAERRQG